MLVSFIGAPISGKTTVAALVFAELKKTGQSNVEFVVEQARRYIAQAKASSKDGKVILTDEDQLAIAKQQLEYENLMLNSVGSDGIVISDSSAINSLLYMSAEFRAKVLGKRLLWEELGFYTNPKNLLFVCAPLPVIPSEDLNRIHTVGQSKHYHEKLIKLLRSQDTPDCHAFNPVQRDGIPLVGPTDFRANEVIRAIYAKLTA